MAQPLESRIPIHELQNSYVVQFEAVDATTGAAVSGVTVSNISIAGDHSGPPVAAKPDESVVLLPVAPNQTA